MDKDLLKRIKRNDRLVRKLLFVNNPADSIKHRLNIMKSLVLQIPRELSDLVKYWSTKVKLHKSVYESSLLLPPLREPPKPQVVGPVPVVAATAQSARSKSTASNFEPKKSVTFRNVYIYLFGPEQAPQAETNLEGSQSPPDEETVVPILKFACDHHHCSNCNDFDAMKYETKQPSSLIDDGNQLSGATSSSTRANGNQTDTAKKTFKFAAISIIPTATSNVQAGQDNSFVQRPLKRTSQALMDHSIAPGSSSLASLHHKPPKQLRTSSHEPLRSHLIALVSAIPPMNDYREIDCYKSLLRTVSTVIGHLMGTSMLEDDELQFELVQMVIDKMNERVRFRFFNRTEFRRDPVLASKSLFRMQHFLKHQITYHMSELSKEANALCEQLALSKDILYWIYCGYCKRDTNHSIVNCPVRNMINSARMCLHCKEDGHLKTVCPKMQT